MELKRPEKVIGRRICKRIDGVVIPIHRLIMQQKLGRELSSKEHVHHIDGNQSNNHIDNLIVLPCGEHTRLHSLGLKRSEETKKRISKANLGKVRSEEFKRKNSAWHKKYMVFTPEHRAKISEALKGRVVPLERRERIRQTLKGRKMPEDQRIKCKIAVQKWWDERKAKEALA